VAIAKDTPFCLPQHLASSADEIFTRLVRANNLHGLGREPFVDGLTQVLGDLNALHPFREGNGRTQRAFCWQLSKRAGHELRWAAMDPRENVTASRASLLGDNSRLRALLDQLIDRPNPGAIAPQPRSPVDHF
jgi:cell filamentation protein